MLWGATNNARMRSRGHHTGCCHVASATLWKSQGHSSVELLIARHKETSHVALVQRTLMFAATVTELLLIPPTTLPFVRVLLLVQLYTLPMVTAFFFLLGLKSLPALKTLLPPTQFSTAPTV
jgi:hypothetical protein